MQDVLIIGAGITGAFTSYLLALQGVSNRVIARNETHLASHQNAGGINPLQGPGIPGLMSEFSLHSYHLHEQHWQEIQRLSGIDFKPQVRPKVMLAFDEAEKQTLLKRRMLYEQTEGFSAQWLSHEALLEQEPRISPQALGGLYTQGNVTLDSKRFLTAVLNSAQALGSEQIQADVIALETQADSVTVTLSCGEELQAKHVILATGSWSDLYASAFSMKTPLKPIKGELLLVELKGKPFAFDLTQGKIGLLHYADHHYWLGGTMDDRGFDFSMSEESARLIQDAIHHVIPGLGDYRIVSHRTGLRPTTADGLPIVGQLPGSKNVYIATGSGPKGMLWSSGIAELCAKMLQHQVDPEAYTHLSPRRFLSDESTQK